jgi:hypothetical protein
MSEAPPNPTTTMQVTISKKKRAPGEPRHTTSARIRSIYCTFETKLHPADTLPKVWETLSNKIIPADIREVHWITMSQDPPLYRVFLQSARQQYPRFWNAVTVSMVGINPSDDKVFNRNRLPRDIYCKNDPLLLRQYNDNVIIPELLAVQHTMAASAVVVAALGTNDMDQDQPPPPPSPPSPPPPPSPPIPRYSYSDLSEYRTALDFLKSPYADKWDMLKVGEHFLGDFWPQVFKTNLVAPDWKLIDIHRAIVQSSASGQNPYAKHCLGIPIEPVTLVVPLLMSIVLECENKTVASIKKEPRIHGNLREIIRRTNYSVTKYGEFLAKVLPVIASDTPPISDDITGDMIYRYNQQKKQMQEFIKKKFPSEWVSRCLALFEAIPRILAQDSRESPSPFVAHLPATPAMPEAVYDFDQLCMLTHE